MKNEADDLIKRSLIDLIEMNKKVSMIKDVIISETSNNRRPEKFIYKHEDGLYYLVQISHDDVTINPIQKLV